MPIRTDLLGNPNTYAVMVHCALDQPLLADDEEARTFLEHLEVSRRSFDCRVFAFAVHARWFVILVQHQSDLSESEEALRQRWTLSRGRRVLSIERLRRRFTSLSGFMQTFLQGFSRAWNSRHGMRGSIWGRRYRACLLADDAALLAAIAWCEDHHRDQVIRTSHNLHGSSPMPVALAAPPLRVGPGDTMFPADYCPPGLSPPPETEIQAWLDRFSATMRSEHIHMYGEAIQHGWALGRPESLTDVLTRLGRGQGRGRSRSLRDLSDELGLCGVWG
jgi:hypothetical protein